MKKSIFKISLFLVCFFYSLSCSPLAGASSDENLTTPAALAEQLTAECFTAQEPANAITKNLTLTLPAEMAEEGVTASFKSSDNSVLSINGETGTVFRDDYAPCKVTLTVTLNRNGETAEKALHLTGMFIIAMSRGVKNGWLGREIVPAIKRAWERMATTCLSEEGDLLGVCVGSGCSMQREYYRKLGCCVNDDHGTGVFLLAAVEVMGLYN